MIRCLVNTLHLGAHQVPYPVACGGVIDWGRWEVYTCGEGIFKERNRGSYSCCIRKKLEKNYQKIGIYKKFPKAADGNLPRDRSLLFGVRSRFLSLLTC